MIWSSGDDLSLRTCLKTRASWEHYNHPEELYSNEFIWQKLEYIHMNPVQNGLVSQPWDYRYSSARNYVRMESVPDIDLITLKVRSC